MNQQLNQDNFFFSKLIELQSYRFAPYSLMLKN